MVFDQNFSTFEHDYAGRLDVCDFTLTTFAMPFPQMRPQLRCNVEYFVALEEENPLKNLLKNPLMSVYGVVLRTEIIAMTKNERHTILLLWQLHCADLIMLREKLDPSFHTPCGDDF